MRSFAFFAFSACAVLVCASTSSRATEKHEVYVVAPLDALGVDTVLLDKLNGALRDEVHALGVATPSVGNDEGAPKCSGDVSCFATAGAKAHADFVVVGSAGLAGDLVHVTLRTITVVTASEYKAVDDEGTADQAERVVRRAAMKLLAPDKYVTSGSLVLATPLEGAKLFVDGKERGTAPFFGPVDGLAPGRREVEVQYPGMTSWRGFVDVAFDAPTRVDVVEKDGALVEVPHAESATTSAAPNPTTATATAFPTTTVMVVASIGSVVVGLVALGGAVLEYGAAATAAAKVDARGQFSQKDIDDNHAAVAAYGILLPVGIVGVVGGGALAAVSLVE